MPDMMLNEEIRRQVRELFENLERPIKILFFGSRTPDLCAYCVDTKQLLEEVSALSDKLSLAVYDLEDDTTLAQTYHIDAVPSFVICADEGGVLKDYGVRYKGIPAGHEFTSLVNDLVLVSRGDSGLRSETRDFLNSLEKPVHLQVFVTPT